MKVLPLAHRVVGISPDGDTLVGTYSSRRRAERAARAWVLSAYRAYPGWRDWIDAYVL